MKFYVVYRNAYRQTQPKEEFNTLQEAREKANAFNKYNQDKMWNSTTAYVYSSKEKIPE